MPDPGVIEVEGAIVERLPRERYRVELGNGHRMIGIVTRTRALDLGALAVGERVQLEISPSDFSRGKIVAK